MKILSLILGPFLKFLGKVAPFIAAFKMGGDRVKKKQLEKNNEILKEQRDNDVTDADAAAKLHHDRNKQ